MNRDFKEYLLAQMEPRSSHCRFLGFIQLNRASAVSTAISLKRIADALEQLNPATVDISNPSSADGVGSRTVLWPRLRKDIVS